jgi:hypothetical protein
MAKVIEFHERDDWKPNRESVPEGQLAKVIMFPDMNSKKPAEAGVALFCASAPSLAHELPRQQFGILGGPWHGAKQ